jgi:glycosyltransferase involved in cell wall biosynthesis
MAQTSPVAVVIPVFNRRLKLLKTLETLVGQSNLPALLIVVDDGSTDGTGEAAREWLGRNARFEWRVLNQTNSGVSVARNVGFAHIGDLPFVCFLDSDDLWPPDFIAEGLRALEGRDELVAAVADRMSQREDKRKPPESLRPLARDPLLWLVCRDGAILSCTMIRSSAARAAGLFEPAMLVSEDTDFLLRLFLLGKVAHSKAAPVLFIKKAPLEPTEPPNLSRGTPELRYLWTTHLIGSLSKLPQAVRQDHESMIRTAVAGRWASVALSAKKQGKRLLALKTLFHAIWWDHDHVRRLKLVWAFFRGRKGALEYFRTRFD